MAFLQITTEVRILQQHFSCLNQNLEKYDSSDNSSDTYLWCPKKMSKLYQTYEKLCTLIEQFNESRGLQISVLFCAVITTVIGCLYFQVIYRLSEIRGESTMLQIVFDLQQISLVIFFGVSKAVLLTNCSLLSGM